MRVVSTYMSNKMLKLPMSFVNGSISTLGTTPLHETWTLRISGLSFIQNNSTFVWIPITAGAAKKFNFALDPGLKCEIFFLLNLSNIPTLRIINRKRLYIL